MIFGLYSICYKISLVVTGHYMYLVSLLGMEESLVDGGNGVEQLVALDLVPDSLGSKFYDFWF